MEIGIAWKRIKWLKIKIKDWNFKTSAGIKRVEKMDRKLKIIWSSLGKIKKRKRAIQIITIIKMQ